MAAAATSRPSSLCASRPGRLTATSGSLRAATAGSTGAAAARPPTGAGSEAPPKPLGPPLRRRELSLCVPRVELRLYRRTRTSSDVVPRPPHFVYLLRCEWTGEQLPRDPATSSGRPPSPRSPRQAARQRRPQSPESGNRSPRSAAGAETEFEDPWPWWDPLPEGYVVRRRWHEIVRFHEALSTELAYDSQQRCRRVKARVPTLPERVDLNQWLNAYAAIGDACCLGRTMETRAEERERSLEELRDLHWIYVRNRLMPYFAEVTAVLQELPTEILAASTSLRKFVTGGVSGRQQPSVLPVQPRFLGPVPVHAAKEDVVAAVQLLRRSGTAPSLLLADRRRVQDPGAWRREASGSPRRKPAANAVSSRAGTKNPTSPSAAAAQLVLAKS